MTASSFDGEGERIFRPTMPPEPYPGLRAFERQEWPIFFGRERMIDDVVDHLIDRRMVVVHGDSGCGKSSLVRAGVLTQLEQNALRSDFSWRACTMLPRGAPIHNLAKALASLDGDRDLSARTLEFHRALIFGQQAPDRLAALLRLSEQDHVCILIDQFEELFRFNHGTGFHQARRFVEFLVGFQKKQPAGLYVILTMRSEFLGACARFGGLAEAVNATQYLLPNMDLAGLMRAIIEPARLYGGEVTTRLAKRLIAESSGEHDQLPLIQHGLNMLWHAKSKSRDDGSRGLAEGAEPFHSPNPRPAWRLDIDDYQGAGGLSQLLSDHADRIMAAVASDASRQRTIEHLFRALSDINADGHAIRRPQSLKALLAVTGAEPSVLRLMIDAFRKDGVSLLAPYGEAAIGETTPIDISHEALIRCWQKLSDPKDGWLQREFQDGMVWKALKVQAEMFTSNQYEILSPAATLDRTAWLEELPSRAWSERHQGGWDSVQELMAASRSALERQATKDRWIRRGLSAGFILFAGLAIMSAWSYHQASQLAESIIAVQQSQSELVGQKARDELERGLPDTAMELALSALPSSAEGGEHIRSPIAAGTLIEAMAEQMTRVIFEGHEGPVYAVGFSPDSRYVVSGSLDRTLRKWDAATGTMLMSIGAHDGAVRAASFSPDQGTMILSCGNDRLVRLWEADTGRLIFSFKGHNGRVHTARFSPDGRRIVSASEDRTIRIWNAISGEPIRVIDGIKSTLSDVAFSYNGAHLFAVATDGTFHVWDASSGKVVETSSGSAVNSKGLGFSADGSRLIASGTGNKLFLTKVGSGELPKSLGGHDEYVWSAEFFPNGQKMVSASADRTLRIWDLGSSAQVDVLRGHRGGVNAVAVSPDSAAIISGSDDGTLRLWQVSANEELLMTFSRPQGAVNEVDLANDDLVVAASEDGNIRLWRADSGLLVRVLKEHEGGVWTVDFSADGKRLASGGTDTKLRLWNVETGDALAAFERHGASVTTLDISADGRQIISGSWDTTMFLWDIASEQAIQSFKGHEEPIRSVKFSPDSQHAVSTSDDNSVRIWDTETGQQLMLLEGHDDDVRAAAYSPDGSRIVSAGAGGELRIWDAQSGEQVMLLVGHTDGVWDVEFSSDGKRLVSGGSDRTIRIWDALDGDQLVTLEQIESDVVSAGFSQQGDHVLYALADGTVRSLWVGRNVERLIEKALHQKPLRSGDDTSKQQTMLDLR